MKKTTDTAIALRASEEIQENGTTDAAIAAIEQQIASGDYPRSFATFMRKVIVHLKTFHTCDCGCGSTQQHQEYSDEQ